MLAPELRHDAAARGSLDQAELEEVRLVDVLDRVLLLPERHRQGREPDRPAVELVHDRAEEIPVDPLEPLVVDLEKSQRLAGDIDSHGAVVAHLGDVADAPQDPVGYPRRPARAAGNLVRCLVGDLDAEDPRRAPDDAGELLARVEVEAIGDAEPIAERRRQEPRPGGRADQCEGREVESEGSGGRALPDDDVEPEVLERRVQDLLHGPVQTVDLVDEEDVVRLERGEDRRHVSLPLERGARDAADADPELLADDEGEARLAEPGRAGEQDMVESLAASLRRFQGDRELLLDPLLADEVLEPARAERAVELVVPGSEHRRGDAFGGAHAALSACRTRSAGESSGSVSASRCSASAAV